MLHTIVRGPAALVRILAVALVLTILLAALLAAPASAQSGGGDDGLGRLTLVSGDKS